MRPEKIGLTGGLGSGKSTVLAMFKKKGAFTWDADAEVHKAFKSPVVLGKIRRGFGSAVVQSKKLNRVALAKKIFSNPTARKQLESILHPIVRREFKRALRKTKKEIAVCDVPLLYESRYPYGFRKVIVVDAPMNVRLKRLKQRGVSLADARARIKAQWPLSKKVKRADFVIRNGGSIQTTQAQVDRLWALLKRGTYGIAARGKTND